MADREPNRHSLAAYVTSLTLLAIVTVALCLDQIGAPTVRGRWAELCLFVFMVCLCEARPISVARSSGVKEIVASTTFTFTLFLNFGPVLAMAVQGVASLIGDLVARKSPLKLTFNLVQYWVSWGAAAFVFVWVEDGRNFGNFDGSNWRWSAAVIGSGLTYFVVNNVLVGLAIAFSSGNQMSRLIKSIDVEEAISDCVLLALSPVVIIVADRSLMFLPLLLLPVYAVYRSASISAEKEHQAMHDSLTGLSNRPSFEANLQRRVDGGDRARAAVLLIDLDRFKEVNDTLGHHAGDQLLRLIGPRIVDVVPDGDVVARFGGDEFAVLLDHVEDEAEARRIAAEISKVLEQPFAINEFSEFNLEVQASIGVAMFPDHGRAPDELIKHADIAMYVAKRLQSGVETYDPSEDHHRRRRLGLVAELRKAIADGQIILYYQPKLDLRSGRIDAVEGLVRWVHPELGVVPPSEFIPVAEHTGLIGPLTSHVLSTASHQAAEWMTSGHEIVVSVNLSARNLHDSGIVHEVAVNLARHQLPARLLRLEITESSIMGDPVRAKRILEQLHGMGVELSIDDFGTGYSSLAYLQNLPVSEIKIDRSFVMDLLSNASSQVIVRSTIDLARNLGLTSTAEGIETEDAQQWLHAAGCDVGQGYYIARPMTAEAFGPWLAAREAAEADARRVPEPASAPI